MPTLPTVIGGLLPALQWQLQEMQKQTQLLQEIRDALHRQQMVASN